MNNLKKRKRLAVVSLVFLLVFITGAAFALVPGTLHFRGRVGVLGPDPERLVQWSLAHVPNGPGDFTQLLNHGPIPNRINLPRPLFDGWDAPMPANVAASQATIHSGGSVIDWDVMFTGDAGVARLYVEAMNMSTIDLARVDFSEITLVVNDITLTQEQLDQMFIINRGTLPSVGTRAFMPMYSHAAFAPRNTTPVYWIEVQWTGVIPPGIPIEYFEPVPFDGSFTDTTRFLGRFTLTLGYEFVQPGSGNGS